MKMRPADWHPKREVGARFPAREWDSTVSLAAHKIGLRMSYKFRCIERDYRRKDRGLQAATAPVPLTFLCCIAVVWMRWCSRGCSLRLSTSVKSRVDRR